MKTRLFLSSVMKRAWSLVKQYGLQMAEALKQAWRVEKLRYKMKTQVVEFIFKKADGTYREARGTLKLDSLPSMEAHGKRKVTDKVVTYYDMDKQEFRCFKPCNLVIVL